MNFSEKLFKLRKEKGYSQEELAEQLNTTRQAISKWENNQGFPETEKLVIIGEIFNVSIDYLLKDTIEDQSNHYENKLYVSEEMAEGYLLQEQKLAKYISIGLTLIVLSFIPYFLFKQNPLLFAFIMIILAATGVIIVILGSSIQQDKYKVLKEKPLLFDENYFKVLADEYKITKKRYFLSIGVAVISFVVGMVAFLLEKKDITSGILVSYYPIFVIMIAIGFYILFRTLPILEAYKLFVKNDEYVNKYSFKIKKKLKSVFNEFLN